MMNSSLHGAAGILGLCLTLQIFADESRVQLPEGVTLPLVILNVDFNDHPAGRPPAPASKEQIEAAALDFWQSLPLRTYSGLDYVTRDRTAVVEAAALGFDHKPVLFNCPDGRQPHWGPRMRFSIPRPLAAVGRRFRVSLDVSMSAVTKMGGISLEPGVGEVRFFEDGTLRLGSTEIARYQPSLPIHLEFVIDVTARRVTVRADVNEPVTVPWRQPAGTGGYQGLRLDGLLPGGHARGPGQIAFDNIKIILEE